VARSAPVGDFQEGFKLCLLVGSGQLGEQTPESDGSPITHPSYEAFKDRHTGK
jgi:hypothetical protein